MSERSTFFNGPLSASDALEQCHSSLEPLVGFHIYQVRAWQPMLRNEDRLTIPTKFIQEFRGFSLESGDEFGAHIVILKYHNAGCNSSVMASAQAQRRAAGMQHNEGTPSCRCHPSALSEAAPRVRCSLLLGGAHFHYFALRCRRGNIFASLNQCFDMKSDAFANELHHFATRLSNCYATR